MTYQRTYAYHVNYGGERTAFDNLCRAVRIGSIRVLDMAIQEPNTHDVAIVVTVEYL